MLTVFLSVLPALLTAGDPLGIGRAVVGAGEGGGPARTLLDGARSPVFGVVGLLLGIAIPPVLFRALEAGKLGKEVFGGPFEGRDRGKIVVMVKKADTSETGHVEVVFVDLGAVDQISINLIT